MHPVLFRLPIPDFLQNLLGNYFTVYSYGFFIVIGAILAVAYMAIQSKRKFGLSLDQVNTLFLLLLFSSFLGGKVFLFFENPSHYGSDLSLLISGTGFVFYGSLLFCIPTMLVFFKYHKLPTLAMLDIMAVTTCIVHAFGRIGCFMAGCCHGIEWHGPLAVVFTNEACLAPLNTPLHPTQLYSVAMIGTILISLLVIKKWKHSFDGQLFISYLILYSIGRSVIEIFRGDISRGYVIDGYVTHSQFISFLIFVVAVYFYIKLKKRRSEKKI